MPYLQMKFLAKKTIQNVTSDKCTGFWTNKTVKRESKTQLAQSIFFSLVIIILTSVAELAEHIFSRRLSQFYRIIVDNF